MENITEKRQISVAIALIKNEKGEILLQKRSDPLIPEADGKWEFPGGRIEYGESPEEAVKRECLEEVGCEIELIRLLPMVQYPIWKRTDNKEQQVFVVCFEAKIKSGTPKASDGKVSEVKWLAAADATKEDLLRGIREYIDLL